MVEGAGGEMKITKAIAAAIRRIRFLELKWAGKGRDNSGLPNLSPGEIPPMPPVPPPAPEHADDHSSRLKGGGYQPRPTGEPEGANPPGGDSSVLCPMPTYAMRDMPIIRGKIFGLSTIISREFPETTGVIIVWAGDNND